MSNGAVVIGASLGGLRLSEQLRSAGYNGPITIVGAERHMPYNRPPLSKDVLLDGTPADGGAQMAGLAFSIRPSLADATWVLGAPAVEADLAGRTVTLADGRRLGYDALGIATGLTPRRLPISGGEACRHVVRTFDDAIRLRQALRPGARIVVAGGGFIGCEVAASATKRGCLVTVVEPLGGPMIRAIGPELSGALQDYHQSNGVQFMLGASIAGIEVDSADPSRVTSLSLSDGATLPADLIVEAVGSTCNVGWLEGNGLDLTDGVLADNAMRAGGRPEVVAAGDAVRFPNPRYDGVPRRVEHWAIPALTARRAAATLAAHLAGREPDTTPFDPVPSFWSDQFGIRLQSLGMPALADRREVLQGSVSDVGRAGSEGVAVGYLRGDKLVGAVMIGLPAARQSHYRGLLG